MVMKNHYKQFVILILFAAFEIQAAEKSIHIKDKSSGKNTTAEAKDNSAIPATSTVPDLDLDKIEASTAIKPNFSRTSSDQKILDKTLAESQEKFDGLSVSHIETLTDCGKLGNIDEIKNCRKNYLEFKNAKTK
jgi:hypothetical protein